MLKSHPKRILIAMGSNASNDLKESYDLLVDAINSLTNKFVTNVNISKFYKTPAFPAESGPDFINCVLSGKTYLSPEHLLNKMHLIEEVIPSGIYVNKWLNMPLDMQKIKTPDQLILPHPRIQDRPFVLIPLGDVAPNWKHPIFNKTSREMLNELAPELSIGISYFA
jgi:2-amino-4-hydroxy-6-hydroxymethyldihydropteridine diphosphokinase